MRLVQRLWGPPVGLAATCDRLDIHLDHHDPLSDAEACASILLKGIEESVHTVTSLFSTAADRWKARREKTMGATLSDFWGKLEQDESGAVKAWHPLVDHSADVAACFEALLKQPALRGRLARLAGLDDLSMQQRQRLCVLAALHDIGKYNHGFQNKALAGTTPRRGHVGEVLGLFASEELGMRLGRALHIERIAPWVEGDDGACRLLIAAICHHGRPRSLNETFPFTIWEPRESSDPFRGIARLARFTEEWFPQAWKTGGTSLPDSSQLQHALCGLVTLADWLGSDTRFFPFAVPPDSGLSSVFGRFGFAREQAMKSLRAIGLDISAGRAQLGEDRPGFDRVSPHVPRSVQQLISDLPVEMQGSITLLEAETGVGKTEAALVRFIVLLQAGFVEGLYFALPTRTAATQIHGRIVDMTKRAFPDEDSRPPVVLAVPGYLRVDETEGKQLPGFEVLWNDDDTNRHRGWAAENPKRYLAGAIVVGTIDQVLLSTLQVSHSHLRASALFRHLLVVDEVHASDAYMNRLLEEVLRRHIDAGGYALLMSATVGSETGSRLLEPGTRDAPSIPFEKALAAPFPRIVHRPRGGEELRFSPVTQRSSHIEIVLLGIAAKPNALVVHAMDAAQKGAKVLILRNTVLDCLETQLALESLAAERNAPSLLFGVDGIVAPHHSRFARDDREALDLSIEARFGKRRSSGGCVAVATQTVQQSLDLDADLLLTDLCPMDVLIQRLGRLHRHEREDRPSCLAHPKVIVVTPSERNLTELITHGGRAIGAHGMGTVYEDLRVLEATWRALERHETLTLPEQSRELVESALHSRMLSDIVSDLGPRWARHAEWVHAELLSERRVASLNLVDWSAHFDESRCVFPSKELSRRIQTRLGEGDRHVNFAKPFISPFGRRVHELTLPAFLAPPAPDDTGAMHVTVEGDRIGFTFAGKPFIYDRHGLRPMSEDQGENHA
jgi:CRISPR-associated endonuclease/helicase Cas3